MSKNLMVGSHKYTSAEYSKNYERIKWESRAEYTSEYTKEDVLKIKSVFEGNRPGNEDV